MPYKTKDDFIDKMLSKTPFKQTDLIDAEIFLLKTVQKTPLQYGKFFSYMQKVYKTTSTEKEPLITGLALVYRLAIKDMTGFYVLLAELGHKEKEFLYKTSCWRYALDTAKFVEQGLYHRIHTQRLPSSEFKQFLGFLKPSFEDKKTETRREKQDNYWCGVNLCLSIADSLEKTI